MESHESHYVKKEKEKKTFNYKMGEQWRNELRWMASFISSFRAVLKLLSKYGTI